VDIIISTVRYSEMKLDTTHIALIVIIICLIRIIIYHWHKVESFANDGRPISCDCAGHRLVVAKSMAKLWIQNLIYIRLAMMANLDAEFESSNLLARLRRNAKDFGMVMTDLYGKTVGDAMERRMVRYIELVILVLQTVRIDSNYSKHKAIGELFASADEIGTYLDALMKDQIELFKNQMRVYTNMLLSNINEYAANNYVNDIRTLDNCINACVDIAFEIDQGKPRLGD